MPKIFVVAHIKPDLLLPAGYEYIGVGPKDLGFKFSDKFGESIAELNPYFSELTALYWIWKNYECEPNDVVGLVHYRRLLVDVGLFPLILKKPVSTTKVNYLLQKYDLIVPESQNLRPDAYNNYGREHIQEDLDFVLTMAEIKDSIPSGSYRSALINMKSIKMCNVFITRKHLLDRYCAWLFPILFYAYKELDISGRNSYQQRAFGFLSERLFNVWLFREKNLKSTSLPMIRLDFSAFKNWNRRRLNNR